MAFENCIDEIVKASGEALSPDDARAAWDEADTAIAKRMRLNPLESRASAAAAVAKELATAEKIAAIIEKRQRAISVMTKLARQEVYDRSPGAEQKAIDSLNVGSTGGGWGRGNSVHAKGQTLRAALVAPMMIELRAKGLVQLFRSRDFEDSVAAEIWRLTDPENPNLPRPGSQQAQDAAKIIGQATEMGRKMQNGAGAWIGKLPGYVMRQDWDMLKVRYAAGRTASDFLPGAKYDWEKHFQAWSKKFLDRVDHEKTFDDPTDTAGVRKYMEYVFNALASGKHEESKGADDWLMGFTGPGNRAKRISQHRSIHFKGPAEMMSSHRDFGHGNLLESSMHGLDKAAQNTALMTTWGPNPQAAFDADVDQMTKRAVERGDFKASDKLRGSWSQSLFKQVNGIANIGGNPTIAAIGSYIRGWNTLRSLGMVLASAVTDVPLTASTLRYAGFSYPQAVAHQLAAIGAHLPQDERDEILKQLSVMLEGITSNLGQRFTSEDGAKGTMAKTLSAFMTGNGIRWWTDNMKAGVALGASSKLAELSGREFAKLPELLKVSLNRYNIGEKEWNLIRQTELAEMRGTKYLTSDGVHQLSDEQVAPHVANDVERHRLSLIQNIAERENKSMDADSREQGWVSKRINKFQTKMDTARDQLGKLEDSAKERGESNEQGLRDRINLLQKKFDLAKWEADLTPASNLGDKIGTSNTAFNEGIKVGETRGKMQRDISALEKKISLSEKQLNKTLDFRRQNFIEYFTEKDAELQKWIGDIRDRQQKRVDFIKSSTDEIPDKLERFKKVQISSAREQIATNLGTYFTDLADEAINQPGAYERAVTSAGLSTGTVSGEAVRAFMQFKGFGISAARRHFWREITRSGSVDWPGLALLITGTTAMGYAAMQIKNTLSGRVMALPQNFDEYRKQGLAAFLQGGGAGIYGDFLFGDTNRYGGGIAETFGGPSVGALADLYRMKSELQDATKAHDFTRLNADAVRTIKNNLPFQNFLWTKAAMDYLVFYGLQEAVNPGYLRRMESRQRDQNQTTYIFPPSQYAVRH